MKGIHPITLKTSWGLSVINLYVVRGRNLPGWKIWFMPGHGHAQTNLALSREGTGINRWRCINIEYLNKRIIEPPNEGEAERPKTLLQHISSLKLLYDT